MQKGVLLFFIIVVLASCVFAQTVIKEKVNVNPSLEENSLKYSAKSVLSVADEVTLPFDADLYVWEYIDGFVQMISPVNKTIVCYNGPVDAGEFPKGSIIKLTTIITWNQQVVDLVFKPYIDSTYFNMFYSTDTINAVGTINIVPAIPKLTILSPLKTSPPDTITAEPKMPKVVCKAQLKNYYKNSFLFKWEYRVSYSLPRRYRNSKTSPYISLCPRNAKIVIVDTTNGNGPQVGEWTVPFKKEKADTILFKAKQPSISGWSAYGGDCDETIKTWDEGKDIFFGGLVYLKVTALDSAGKIIAKDSLEANRIMGINPEADSIYKYASSKELKAILINESEKSQFVNSTKAWPYNQKNTPYYGTGWPKYGFPNGYGLMQIDNGPAPTEYQLWNWKANVDEGEVIFNKKKKNAKNRLDKHGENSYTSEQLLIESFQEYNGGPFYRWSKRNDKYKWEAIKGKSYGQTVFNTYKNLK